MNYIERSRTITQTGASITTSGVSASAALPVCNGGGLARGYRITATVSAHIRLGVGAPTAVATDVLVQPGDSMIINRCNFTHIAAIQNAAAGVVIVTPLDD